MGKRERERVPCGNTAWTVSRRPSVGHPDDGEPAVHGLQGPHAEVLSRRGVDKDVGSSAAAPP